MQIINETRNIVLARQVIMADSFFPRLKGLLGKSFLPEGWCLILKPCCSVHTMFMRFAIDILFLDRENKVVSLVNNMHPFRFSSIVARSQLAIELPAGTLKSTNTSAGDILTFTKG